MATREYNWGRRVTPGNRAGKRRIAPRKRTATQVEEQNTKWFVLATRTEATTTRQGYLRTMNWRWFAR